MAWRTSPSGWCCSGASCAGSNDRSSLVVPGLLWRTRGRQAVRGSSLLALALLLGVLAPLQPASAASLSTGQAEYGVSWNGIPAGGATVAVRADEQGGQPVYRVEAAARTNWFADLLWHFRGHAASSFTSDKLVPLGYRYDREENNKHIVTDVTFNQSDGVTGTRYRGKDAQVIELQDPGLLDPITAIFRALVQPVHLGEVMRSEVFTGEARYRVEITVTGEDTVTVTAGTYRAWRMEPRVWKIGSGVDSRLRRATLWVAQEAPQIPVRIRSEVFIGAVNCDLLQVRPLGA